jgi:hypothetical protein
MPAEAVNHLSSVGMSTFTYNAYGWRVYNSSGSVSYLLDPSGQFLGGRWSGGGGNSAVFLGSRMLAEYMSNGVDFAHPNVLGSDTQVTGTQMTGANSIEERVIEMMLTGSKDGRLGYLRDQMHSASVVKRTYTGYGFFTHLSVPETCAPVLGEPSFHLSDVLGTSPKLQLPIGFVLFIKTRSSQYLGGSHV